jgi:hypothetical protein
MRKELKNRVGRRGRFRATFQRFGSKRDPRYPQCMTALFLAVRDESGEIVTDHLWFDVGDQLRRLELQPGDEVFFVARVQKYRKRNPNAIDDDDPRFVEDYRLSYPSKVSKLGAQITEPMPLFDQADAAGSGSASHEAAR